MRTNSFFTPDLRTRNNRYFSVDIKKKVVQDLERNLTRVTDVCKAYDVSKTSVYKWIYKYSTMAKKQHRQVVEPKSDTQKIIALEERIKELERIIGQKQLDIDFKDKMIELAEQRYNIEIKKKSGTKPSSGSGVTKKGTSTK